MGVDDLSALFGWRSVLGAVFLKQFLLFPDTQKLTSMRGLYEYTIGLLVLLTHFTWLALSLSSSYTTVDRETSGQRL